MVRHHVAQRAGRVVELAALLDADRLGDRDLHVVDVVAVPQRLEEAVGEAEDQDVLHRLLAEIVIDAEDLLLARHAQDLLVERPADGRSWPNGFSMMRRRHCLVASVSRPALPSWPAITANSEGGVAR